MFLTIALAACTVLSFALVIRSHRVGEPLRWFVVWLAAAMVFATMCLGASTFDQSQSAMARTYITEFASVAGVTLVIAAFAWLAEIVSRRRRPITVRQR